MKAYPLFTAKKMNWGSIAWGTGAWLRTEWTVYRDGSVDTTVICDEDRTPGSEHPRTEELTETRMDPEKLAELKDLMEDFADCWAEDIDDGIGWEMCSRGPDGAPLHHISGAIDKDATLEIIAGLLE